MAPKVLVVGPCSWNDLVYVDQLPDARPQMLVSTSSWSTLGGTSAGKALNLAWLGADVTVATLLGDDDEGRHVVSRLTRAGVHVVVDLVEATERHLNLLDPKGRRVSIYLHVPQLTERSPRSRRALDSALGEAAVAVVDLADHARPVLAAAKEHGLPVWCDLHDYDGRSDFHQDFLDAADVVFLNDDGMPDPLPFMRSVAERGVTVVVTRGAAGALAVTPDGAVHTVDAAPVETIVDTNGAGDAFFSGYLVAHLDGADTDQSLQAGAEQAARCLQSPELAPAGP